MEIKLTEQEVLLLRMIIARYENELETQIENNTYPEKFASIKAKAALDAVSAIHQKLCIAEMFHEMEVGNAKSLDD